MVLVEAVLAGILCAIDPSIGGFGIMHDGMLMKLEAVEDAAEDVCTVDIILAAVLLSELIEITVSQELLDVLSSDSSLGLSRRGVSGLCGPRGAA